MCAGRLVLGHCVWEWVFPVPVALVGADSRFSSQDFGVGMISCRFCVVVV